MVRINDLVGHFKNIILEIENRILKLVFSLLFVFFVSGVMTANGMLVGDGKEESNVILVGKVLSFVENKTSLETNYQVEVEKYLKIPENYDTNTKTITVISPGLRQYDDPQQMMIYDKIFDIDDRVLFLLYQKDGTLRESLYSQTTKSNCSPKQLLDEMYGETGLHISQNNQSRHFYTNQSIDLTYYGYNRDLMSEKKDFEFKVNVPKTDHILSEKTQLDFQECKRTASTSWSFTPTVAGRYTFHSIIGNNEGGSESFSGFLIKDYVKSPLKQFKSGIQPDEITCKERLELVIKTDHRHHPMCLTPDTKSKMIQRGLAALLITVGPKNMDVIRIQENEAISLIKKQYPQLQDFPSDGLPPKIIRSEKSDDGLYMIFETLGSGYPILEAECFLVDNSNIVTQIGHYKHTGGMETNISFKICN